MQTANPKDTFLDALYSAALSASGWMPALKAYAELIDAPFGAVNVHVPNQVTSSHVESLNTSTSFMKRSREHWLAQEPWVLRGYEIIAKDPLRTHRGFVFHGASEVTTSDLLESAWYQDFGREYYLQDCLSLSAASSDGVMITLSGLTGTKSLRLFSDKQRTLTIQMLSEFRRAVALHARLSRRHTIEGTATQWSSSSLPVIMMRAGKIVHANAAGEAALECGDIIALRPGRNIRIIDPMLSDLAKSHELAGASAQATLVATATSGERWLAQLMRVNQLAGSLLAAAGADEPAVLMILTPLDNRAAGRMKVLQSLTVLTPTERQVASQLLCGDTVVSIARHRRQSAETIRWHIRNMIEKTGAKNLADLHRILALLLPLQA